MRYVVGFVMLNWPLLAILGWWTAPGALRMARKALAMRRRQTEPIRRNS